MSLLDLVANTPTPNWKRKPFDLGPNLGEQLLEYEWSAFRRSLFDDCIVALPKSDEDSSGSQRTAQVIAVTILVSDPTISAEAHPSPPEILQQAERVINLVNRETLNRVGDEINAVNYIFQRQQETLEKNSEAAQPAE